ncbi:hypothetical protein [Sulfitobacter sp. JB4-11]|uniref:hypothetical protein n=1 Tax=Sulfitobacter rhodophyticola TaxID=3238304 RepID=UPI003513B26D
METTFSKELSDALDTARRMTMQKKSRLRALAGGKVFGVERMWKSGFAIDLADAPRLRGLVDVFDGSHHLFQCLIVASREEPGVMCYDFKRATPVATEAALDFVQEPKVDVLRLPRPALT